MAQTNQTKQAHMQQVLHVNACAHDVGCELSVSCVWQDLSLRVAPTFTLFALYLCSHGCGALHSSRLPGGGWWVVWKLQGVPYLLLACNCTSTLVKCSSLQMTARQSSASNTWALKALLQGKLLWHLPSAITIPPPPLLQWYVDRHLCIFKPDGHILLTISGAMTTIPWP